MKSTTLLRILAVQAIAPRLAAKALAQRDDLSQQYCSSQNTADNYAAVSNIYQSNGACFEQCIQNYAFAVVQYQQCWCSDYIPADQQSTGSCNTPCPGYPDESCGNNGSGLYGYIPLRRQPSGTAGAASSTEASSTPTPTPSSTSTTPVSTSIPTSYSSSTSEPPTSSSTVVLPSSTTSTLVTSSRPPSSSQVLTSRSSQTSTTPTTTSQEPASTTAAAQTTPTSTSTSAAPATTSSTSSTSSSTTPAAVSTTSSTPTSATFTPSPVVSTRVVTLSGAVTTETVTSTPSVIPASAPAFTENQQKSISGGAIAGIVIGLLLFFLLLLLALLCFRRRKRRESISEIDAATTSGGGRRSPRRNVSVLSKVGLLARNNTTSRNHQDMSENLYDDNVPATGQNSVRHSMLFNHGGSEGIAPVSPLAAGGYAGSGQGYGQEDSRRYSRPLVYDQRLNPSALWANAEANGSRVSIQDHADYSRSVGGRLGVVNPDTRSSFASSRG